MPFIFTFLMIIYSTMLQADETADAVITSTTKPSSTPRTKQECRQVVVSHKADDSVEYKAGVDANDDAVVPADLTPPKTYGLDQGVEIDLNVPFGGRGHHSRGHHGGHGGWQNNGIDAGYAIIGPDGQVSINGENIGDDEAEQIASECRRLYPDL